MEINKERVSFLHQSFECVFITVRKTILMCLFTHLFICLCCRVSVSPLNLVSLNQHNRPSNNTKPTSNSKTVDSEHENVRKKRLSLRELLESKLVTDREVLRGGRKLTTQQSKGSFEDDVSTIELAGEDSNECSLQGHPRSRGSLGLSSAVSQGSDGNGQKSGSKSSSVGDYKQNFPYEPPRHT